MSPELDDKTKKEIEHLIYSGQKLTAIKVLREATGLALKEAKEAVEEMSAKSNNDKVDEYSVHDKKGCASILIVGSGLVAALAYTANKLIGLV